MCVCVFGDDVFVFVVAVVVVESVSWNFKRWTRRVNIDMCFILAPSCSLSTSAWTLSASLSASLSLSLSLLYNGYKLLPLALRKNVFCCFYTSRLVDVKLDGLVERNGLASSVSCNSFDRRVTNSCANLTTNPPPPPPPPTRRH